LCYNIINMKHAAIAAILFIFALNMAGQPNATSHKNNTSAEPKSPAMPTLENKGVTADHAEQSDNDPPKWYAPAERPDWWLVVIAGLTGLAIAYQAREMTRATGAMRESTKLQEVGLRQWIDVGDWAITPSEMLHYAMTSDRRITQKPEEIKLEIQFRVLNNTPRAITIMNITTNIHILGRADWKQFVMDEESIVTPNGSHPAFVIVTLKDGEVDLYILKSIPISFVAKIAYRDAMGKPNDQSFPMLFECNRNGFVTMGYKGKYPAERKTDDQNQN